HSVLGSCLELLTLAGDLIKLVVREIAPLLLDLAFELFQFPSMRFQSIAVSLCYRYGNVRTPPRRQFRERHLVPMSLLVLPKRAASSARLLCGANWNRLQNQVIVSCMMTPWLLELAL